MSHRRNGLQETSYRDKRRAFGSLGERGREIMPGEMGWGKAWECSLERAPLLGPLF